MNIEQQVEDLRQSFVGAMLAHKWAIGALIAASPEAAARLLAPAPEAIEEWLQSKPLSDAAIAAARAEIDGIQKRARSIIDQG